MKPPRLKASRGQKHPQLEPASTSVALVRVLNEGKLVGSQAAGGRLSRRLIPFAGSPHRDSNRGNQGLAWDIPAPAHSTRFSRLL